MFPIADDRLGKAKLDAAHTELVTSSGNELIIRLWRRNLLLRGRVPELGVGFMGEKPPSPFPIPHLPCTMLLTLLTLNIINAVSFERIECCLLCLLRAW